MAPTQNCEPCQGKNHGPDDADKDGGAPGVVCGGRVRVGMIVWRFGVVADGEERALRDWLGGGEFAKVELSVSIVVVCDAEVLVRRDAKGQGSTGAEVVLAGKNGGEGLWPSGMRRK